MSLEPDLRVEITDTDVHYAKKAWMRAWQGDASNEVVSTLYDDYARLVSAQAQQLADDVRRSHRRMAE